MKLVPSLTAAAILTLGMLAVAPAQAAYCFYKPVKLDGRVIESFKGYGTGRKVGTACNRARRECNRRLDRAYRRGQLPRGVTCKRATSG